MCNIHEFTVPIVYSVLSCFIVYVVFVHHLHFFCIAPRRPPSGSSVGNPRKTNKIYITLQINSENKNETTAHRIAVQGTEVCQEILTPPTLLKMFELDFDDRKGQTPDQMGLSSEDRQFLSKTETVTQQRDGHYQIPLPFRQETINMPFNREQAAKRANWQKRKMLRNEDYRRDYTAFVSNLIKQGYAEKCTESAEAGRVWYLPHHGLYHPKKRDKIRVVFDCSATYDGTSLNDQLLQGPDLANNVTGVLLRFREDEVAFVGDIEAMFHQVNVPENQRDYLRFLWWPNGDLSTDLQEYRMTVHIFGAASSPSVCNLALHRTAENAATKYGPRVKNTILRNFYVDDCLKSVDNEDTAMQLIEDLRGTCQDGGFHLRKFSCNRRRVLESIPEEERSKEVQTKNLDYEDLPVERTLGMEWSVESDKFVFQIVTNRKPVTRRGILSVIASVYDPLGFAAPFLLPAKKLLQELCRMGDLGWDNDIPEVYQNQWTNWLMRLPELELLKVDRCLKPPGMGTITSTEVHIFSDASSSGYGAVAYLRLCDDKGGIHCAFLIGKSRLAPIKVTTIPRLELTAATVAVRLSLMLRNELDIEIDQVYFHTDSMTVLRYIANERKRYHVFVANRVQLIQDHTTIDQWKFVNGIDNPADEASRGIDSIRQTDRWLTGPSFIWESSDDWPDQPSLGSIEVDDPEVKRSTTSCPTEVAEISPTRKVLEYFSDMYRLKRAVAVFRRVQHVLKHRIAE